MRLGCHAVLFKEKIKNNTDEILKGISTAGFKGFEMGLRFFGTDNREYLTECMEKYGLELTGFHVGGSFADWEQKPEENMKKVMLAVEFLKDMPNKNIILSGSDFKDGDLKAAVKNIQKAALICDEAGVCLHYHNHNWEFTNEARIFKALVQYAPSLNFAFDLGWIFKGGFDPIELIQKHSPRISYLHLRDIRDKEGREFPDLGEGDFDYVKLMAVVDKILGSSGWAVVEYETGEEDFERYARARTFLAGLGY